jgi:hypothetical protein
VTDWMNLFATYRVVMVRDDEVVQGVLHPEIDVDHPVVRDTLTDWKGVHFVHRTPAGTELTLVRRLARRPKERWGLHALLFVLTAITTSAAGAMFLGRVPFRTALLPLGPFAVPIPVGVVLENLLLGGMFSGPLLMILLGHELGHYLVARWHKMDVSPPYFIPSPHWINLIGTFGAFIRLRSPMINRAMLLDVGAAGPIVSFVLSIPAVVVGLLWSRTVRVPGAGEPAFAVLFDGQPIWLGGSLLFNSLAHLVRGTEGVLLLHPLAFAGWLGLFVTALNLFPLAQLDGGHILYALVGGRQRYAGMAFLALLLVLGNPWWGGWWGWWLWAGLILLVGRGSIRHPPVFHPEYPVTGARRKIGWVCVAIFVLTFVAMPIRV